MDAYSDGFLLAGSALFIGAWFLRRARARRHAARRTRERERWQEQQRERREQRVLANVTRFFPWLKDRMSKGGRLSRQIIEEILRTESGVVIGTGPANMPIIARDADATRHGLALGRTGSGKTTLMNHVLFDALQRHNVVVIAFEPEAVRDQILPKIPLKQAHKTVVFRPAAATQACPVRWNPFQLEDGEDQARCANEVYHAFKQATDEESIGPRSNAIARNTFAALVGVPDMSFASIHPFLEDPQFRASVLAHVSDPEVKRFWVVTFESLPDSAAQPFLSRIDEFLQPEVREAICAKSTFSLRVINDGNLLVDLSNLSPLAMRMLGALFLARLQVVVMERSELPEKERPFTRLFIDELHLIAGTGSTSAYALRQILSRGRRMGLGCFFATQHPEALSRSVRAELFGNIGAFFCFAVGAPAAPAAARELPTLTKNGELGTVPPSLLVALPIGVAYIRLSAGAQALRVKVNRPATPGSAEHGREIERISWRTFAAAFVGVQRLATPTPAGASATEPPNRTCETDGAQPEPLAGRGGAQHKVLQATFKAWSDERGFRAHLEYELLGGATRVDVYLERDQLRVAIEVCLTNSSDEIVRSVTSCLSDGLDHVVVVVPDDSRRGQVETVVRTAVLAQDRNRVHVVPPRELRSLLDEWSQPEDSEFRAAGYRVRVDGPAGGQLPHRQALARLVGKALQERGSS